MLSKDVTTYLVYRKLKWLIYAKKCKYPKQYIHLQLLTQYNLLNLMMTNKPATEFSDIYTTSFYVSVLFHPSLSPHTTSFHFHFFFLKQNLKQSFCGENTQMQKLFLSTRPKTGFVFTFYRDYLKISLCWEWKYMFLYPLWKIQGAWKWPMPGLYEENMLYHFSNHLSSDLYLDYKLK